MFALDDNTSIQKLTELWQDQEFEKREIKTTKFSMKEFLLSKSQANENTALSRVPMVRIAMDKSIYSSFNFRNVINKLPYKTVNLVHANWEEFQVIYKADNIPKNGLYLVHGRIIHKGVRLKDLSNKLPILDQSKFKKTNTQFNNSLIKLNLFSFTDKTG